MTTIKRRAFLLGATGAAATAILAACGGEEIAATATRAAPTVNAAATGAATVVSGAATIAPTAIAGAASAAVATGTRAATTTTGSAVATSAAPTAGGAAATGTVAATSAGTTATTVGTQGASTPAATAGSTAAPAGTAAPATSGSAPAGTVVAADGIRAEATPSGMVSGAIPMLQGRLSVRNLRMAFVPGDDPSTFFMNYNELFAYLKQAFGVEVTGTVGANYTAVITALGARRIEVAGFGPFSYILAKEQANAECLLLGETADGKLATYTSLIITPADSPINTLADIRGKNMAFVDAASTSGHLVPAYTLLQKAGLRERTDYQFIYANNHPAVYEAVANKKVDAGAIASDIFEAGVMMGTIDRAKVKVIDTSFDIPGSPYAVRGDLPAADKEALLQAFLAINDRPRTDSLYQRLVVRGGFGTGTVRLRRGDDRVYDDLRKVPAAIGLDVKGLVR